ncbi:MAG TPA: sulfatase-like hydrolase/transferase [Chthoniobacteraceae bacterium]|nr:sulfatase-like hydrolase/transferase [Chthoniobacteraceae bacterium]
MNRQPNLLLIFADQFRGDCLSALGHPAVLTANLDELAGAGTAFTRAYSTCPSCVPARRALLTGLHPATSGLVGMSSGYPITQPTLPGALRDAGYQTVMIGRKMHQSPPTARNGFEQVTLGSTSEEDDAYALALEHQTGSRAAIRDAGISFNGWTARPWHLDDNLHPTAWVTRECRRFLRTSDDTCPLFLTASYQAPHPPLFPPAFYFDRYLRMDLPAPAIGEWAAVPPQPQAVESARVVLKGEALRSAQAGYFGMINHLDDQLFWLIRDFKARSAAQGRPWVIAFTSDHGEMLGDHYHFRKCEPYEGSARVPFLLAASPGMGWRSGGRNASPVCLEDLFPTLAEAGNAAAPTGLDGKSLLPILEGRGTRVRDLLHGEHARQYSQEQANHYLTDGSWKYIWRPFSGEEQLFHLAEDPHELHDRTRTAPAEVSRLREALIDRLRDRPEGFVCDGALTPVQETPHYLPDVIRRK